MNTDASLAALCRERDPRFAAWARGRGLVERTDTAEVRVAKFATFRLSAGRGPDLTLAFRKLDGTDWLRRHSSRPVSIPSISTVATPLPSPVPSASQNDVLRPSAHGAGAEVAQINLPYAVTPPIAGSNAT